MTNKIIDTSEIAEIEGQDYEEPLAADISATIDPENTPIEFHVQLNSWTQHEMQNVIVEAAARQIANGYTERGLEQQVNERAIELISKKIDDVLSGVAEDVLNKPVTSPFGEKEPVTMGAFIGLCGREFLETRVDHRGQPTKDTYRARTRAQYIVENLVDRDFNRELEAEKNKMFKAARKAISDAQLKIINEQRDSLRKSISLLLEDKDRA